MRYNQHCVLFLIILIILMFHLQQVSISRGTMSEDEIFRTGRKVLLKDRINSRQFRTRTIALRRVVDAIAGRQPNFKSQEESPSSIKKSNTLVYNRIDKAGSTTLISMSEFRKILTLHYILRDSGKNGLQKLLLPHWSGKSKYQIL